MKVTLSLDLTASTSKGRHLDSDVHRPGKRNTQKIERMHLT
jgi:hypothetical protein